jgi:hypothetical protein
MQAIDLGIHPRTLYEMRDKVMIHQLTRGLYRLATLPPTPELDLVAIAARIPRATVCLASALAYHRIVTTSPQAVQIALPRGTKAPTLEPPPGDPTKSKRIQPNPTGTILLFLHPGFPTLHIISPAAFACRRRQIVGPPASPMKRTFAVHTRSNAGHNSTFCVPRSAFAKSFFE